MLVVLPFWTSFIVRAFSWMLFLNETGPVAVLLRKYRLLDGDLGIIDTHIGTIIALSLFCIMIVTISIYTVIEGLEKNILEASKDLGATQFQTFKWVILPLSYPGLSIGVALSFIICFGDYVAPTLLGGGINLLQSQLMVHALKENFDVPAAATHAVFLLLTIVSVSIPVLYFGRKKY
jgi:spermidine/putrescine transport system permease protein